MIVINDRNLHGRQTAAPKAEYGVTPTHVMASMSGLDFVRAIFASTIAGAADHAERSSRSTARPNPAHVVIHSVPGLRHYNPIGSVHGGYAAILLDSAMGLAVQTTLPAGTGYTTLEFKISFIARHDARTPARSAPRARRSTPAAAPLPPRRASPTPRAALLAHATTTCLVFEIRKGT